MSAGACRTWLPDSAIVDGALHRRFAAIAQDWAEKWCVPGTRTVVRLERASFGLPSAPGPRSWVSAQQSVRLALTARAPLIVARACLGLKRLPARKAGGDHMLLEAVETKVVSDFAEMAALLVPECRSLGPEDAAAVPRALEGRDGDGIILSVDTGRHGTFLDMFIHRDLACAARRRIAGPVPSPRRLGYKNDALVAQEVTVSARAGNGQLTLAEYKGLAPGDVLILDRHVSSGLELVIDGRAVAGPRCDIRQTPDGAVLQISGEQHAG